MVKIKLTEEARNGIIVVLALLSPLLLMLLISFFLGGSKKAVIVDNEKEKTVILKQPKQDNSPPVPLAKSVVSTVRDAIKQGNYSTAYMEIRNVSKNSPEYEELSKLLAEETRRRKAPGVYKDTGASPSAPIRYLDEATPRDRSADAIYIYFVDVSGTLLPRFCIQATAKRRLGITGFTITADGRKLGITPSTVKTENTGKGVAEWYDAPLDRSTHEAVQAMIRAKKVTLTIIGSGGKTTRDVTDSERKGFSRILDGYTALGGSLNYLQSSSPGASPRGSKRP